MNSRFWVCGVLLCVLVSTVQAGQSAAPATASAAKPWRCALSVQQLVENAPEYSVAAVRRACNPAKGDFCKACICTVSSNFVPATLVSAGVLTDKTSAAAADEAIGSCAPSSHVALLQLGALDQAWSNALNSKCGSQAALGSSCEAYMPETLPVKKAKKSSKERSSSNSSCPFGPGDIKAEELKLARTACGAYTPDTRFCSTCLCAIQSSLDAITKKHTAAAAAAAAAAAPRSDNPYTGCYVVLTQALVEGEVLTPEAATALGSEQCRAVSQLAPAQRRAACGAASSSSKAAAKPAAVAESAAVSNATVKGEARPAAAAPAAAAVPSTSAQRSWGSLSGPSGFAGVFVLLISLVLTAAV